MEEGLGPEQVRHLTAPEDSTLIVCLEGLLPTGTDARGLIDVGAVYVDRTRCLPGAHDLPVSKGAYLRVHCSPRRFPEARRVNWKDRIVVETEDFVVLDKPGGVPVHASLDNCVETALECTAQVLSRSPALHAPSLHALHRLDVPTHGLLVMGRTARFTSHFNWLMRNRQVHKEYKALTWKPPALGKHVHYMENSRRSPKAISTLPREGWQDCVLEVHSVERKTSDMLSHVALDVMRAQLALREQGVDSDGISNDRLDQGRERTSEVLEAFQVRIELHTGRTHQIRAQMSALGCPLVGDEMYGFDAAVNREDLGGAEGASMAQAAGDEEAGQEGQGRGRKRQVDKLAGGSGEHGENQNGDEHANKWRARDMETRGSLALQAFRMSFNLLAPPQDAAVAQLPSTAEPHLPATPAGTEACRGCRASHSQSPLAAKEKEGEAGDLAAAAEGAVDRGGRNLHGKGQKKKRRKQGEGDSKDKGCNEPARLGQVQTYELCSPWWMHRLITDEA